MTLTSLAADIMANTEPFCTRGGSRGYPRGEEGTVPDSPQRMNNPIYIKAAIA